MQFSYCLLCGRWWVGHDCGTDVTNAPHGGWHLVQMSIERVVFDREAPHNVLARRLVVVACDAPGGKIVASIEANIMGITMRRRAGKCSKRSVSLAGYGTETEGCAAIPEEEGRG